MLHTMVATMCRLSTIYNTCITCIFYENIYSLFVNGKCFFFLFVCNPDFWTPNLINFWLLLSCYWLVPSSDSAPPPCFSHYKSSRYYYSYYYYHFYYYYYYYYSCALGGLGLSTELKLEQMLKRLYCISSSGVVWMKVPKTATAL